MLNGLPLQNQINSCSQYLIKEQFMKYLSILILFFSINVNAQIIKGIIVDDENNSAIKNAHIINADSYRGTISDSTGYFEISTENNLKKLIVSCVGYKDTVLIINETKGHTIRMRKACIQIEEVSVYGKKPEEKYLGLNKKSPNEFSFSNGNSTELGWTLYFPYNETGIVKSFGIHVVNSANNNIKLRLRFLEPDTSFKTLGFDKLMNEIVTDRLVSGWNEIIINDNTIRISENGLLVRMSFEGIEHNDNITISGSSKINDYNWVSSLDYTKDFPLKISRKKIKPVVRMLILR